MSEKVIFGEYNHNVPSPDRYVPLPLLDLGTSPDLVQINHDKQNRSETCKKADKLEDLAFELNSFGNPLKAATIYLRAAALYQKDKDYAGMTSCQRSAGEIYLMKNRFSAAEPLLRTVLAYDLANLDNSNQHHIQQVAADATLLASALNHRKHFEEAKTICKEILPLLVKYDQYKVSQSPLLAELAECQKQTGNLKDAWIEKNKSQYLRDDNNELTEASKSEPPANGSIRNEIEQLSDNPESLLIAATKDNRVIAIGEEHPADFLSLQRTYLASIMPQLKQAGATHLALEIPASEQTRVDTFIKTRHPVNKPPLQRIEKSNYETSIAQFGFSLLEKDIDYLLLIDEAAKAGLKVVAVDYPHLNKLSLRELILGPIRDRFMSDKIDAILQDSDKNKVIFFAGAVHTAKQHSTFDNKRTAELLQNKGYRVLTAISQSSEPESLHGSLYPYTNAIKTVKAVPLAKTSGLPSLSTCADDPEMQLKYSWWDTAIIFPRLNMDQRQVWFESKFKY